jgi:hypothetical protein
MQAGLSATGPSMINDDAAAQSGLEFNKNKKNNSPLYPLFQRPITSTVFSLLSHKHLFTSLRDKQDTYSSCNNNNKITCNVGISIISHVDAHSASCCLQRHGGKSTHGTSCI